MNINRRSFFLTNLLFSLLGIFKFKKSEYPKKHDGFQFERKENLHYNYIKNSDELYTMFY